MKHLKPFERFVSFLRRLYVSILTISLVLCYAADLRAERLQLFNRPLDVYGFLSQNVQYCPNNAFDTEEGVNAAIWSAIFEGAYRPAENFNAFAQVVLTGKDAVGFKLPKHRGAQRVDRGARGRLQDPGHIPGHSGQSELFYGRENEPLLRTAGPPRFEFDAVPGINLLHPVQEGFFPRLKFVGGTLSRDLSELRGFFLGLSPVLRIEAFYAFNNGFLRSLPAQGGERFERHDEIRWSVGLDWKVRLPSLSPSGIVISPQFFHRRVSGISSEVRLTSPSGSVTRDNHSVSLMLRTAYFNERMPVSLFWFRDMTGKAGYWRPSIGYLWDAHWAFEAGALFFNGETKGESLEVFDHKDYFYLKVSYKWG